MELTVWHGDAHLSSQNDEMEEQQIQGKPRLHRTFKSSLSYAAPPKYSYITGRDYRNTFRGFHCLDCFIIMEMSIY